MYPLGCSPPKDFSLAEYFLNSFWCVASRYIKMSSKNTQPVKNLAEVNTLVCTFKITSSSWFVNDMKHWLLLSPPPSRDSFPDWFWSPRQSPASWSPGWSQCSRPPAAVLPAETAVPLNCRQLSVALPHLLHQLPRHLFDPLLLLAPLVHAGPAEVPHVQAVQLQHCSLSKILDYFVIFLQILNSSKIK